MDAPAKEKNAVPVDLLGRQEIVDRIMKILEVISEKKSSCTFALNGAWGTGKTFVLNMLMNQLWEYHSDKYIVFHYNCWQYDYYEEPLIAIVAAMLDSVDEENHLLPAHLRDKAKAGMELAKPVLQKIATDFVKNKIGVDLTEVVSSAKAYQDALDGEKQKKAEACSFDEFYSFKKAIQQAQEQIRKLSKDRTLVVVVDELDRCLPSYAIKVLERLHHLFVEMDNTAVVMAVDKGQLDTTVKQIFGDNTETIKYLRKFINFELNLDVGSISGNFSKKHQEYFDLFDESLINTDFNFDEFFSAIFFNIDIRTQEEIINRNKTIHMMLFPYQKKDYSFLCCELILGVFHKMYGGCSVSHPYSLAGNQTASIISGIKYPDESTRTNLDCYFESLCSSPAVSAEHIARGQYDIYVMDGNGIIQQTLLYYVSHLDQNSSIHYHMSLDEALGDSPMHPSIVMFDMAGESFSHVKPTFRNNLIELQSFMSILEILQ